MPSEIMLADREAIPMLSAPSLQRPLVDEELHHLWGDELSTGSDALIDEWDRILREGDEHDRAVLEAYIRSLILQLMGAHMFRTDGGFSDWLGNTLPEAVDRFNRYIR